MGEVIKLMTPYQRRALQQARDWVNGQSIHNRVDDECCPDFSCCMPELFVQDRLQRVADYNSLAAMYGQPTISDS